MKGDGAGRKPKPTMLHKLHGTARANRKRPYEPMPVGDLTDAPEWMNETQKAGWDYAISNSPPGLLKLIDRGMLALWVEAEDRHRIATMTQSTLNASTQLPFLVKGPDGMMMSPYVEVIDRAAKIMFRAADSMGFSPVARPRLKLVKPGDEDTDAKDNPWRSLKLIPGGKAS